jgi:hypothetical protein
MKNRQITDLVLQTVPMAVWRGKPESSVPIHPDEITQMVDIDRAVFLRAGSRSIR